MGEDGCVHLPDVDNGEELAVGKDLSKTEEFDSERRKPSPSVKSLGPMASRAVTMSATGALPAAILLVVILASRQARMSQPILVWRQV